MEAHVHFGALHKKTEKQNQRGKGGSYSRIMLSQKKNSHQIILFTKTIIQSASKSKNVLAQNLVLKIKQ